jgi:hypothetical protein
MLHLEIAPSVSPAKPMTSNSGRRRGDSGQQAVESSRETRHRVLRALTHFDRLYIGGGNSRHVTLEFPRRRSTGVEQCGMKGAALWRDSSLTNHALRQRRADRGGEMLERMSLRTIVQLSLSASSIVSGRQAVVGPRGRVEDCRQVRGAVAEGSECGINKLSSGVS